ncbi:MAG: insulinase family protein, partial [Chlamydiota bacterium]
TIIKDQNELKILTPSLQQRAVTKFQLENGLKVLVVTDHLLDKSGASLTVGSGSLDEPSAFPGLAHFLEHMLFMGTEKYPDENLYWDFIKTHGGETNAFTDNDRTAYMFSISNDAFLTALDQFAQFFIAPLFNQKGVEKEMHAVDQEYRNYLSSDDWRVLGLIQSLNAPESPTSKFTVGSLETLSSTTTKDLKDWWQTHYSANEMTLVIYSPLPIDLIQKAVIEDFSAIKSVKVEHPSIPYSLLPSYTDKIIKVQSIQDSRALYFYFDVDKKYYNQIQLLEKALQDQSALSFLRSLQEKGLVTSLDAMDGKLYDRLSFLVKISLTESGEKDAAEIIDSFYALLAQFQRSGIPEGYFKQVNDAARLSYAYQFPQDIFNTVMQDGAAVLDEDITTYPQNNILLTDYNPEKMQALLSTMTMAHSYVLLLTPEKIQDKTERWFGSHYQITPFSPPKERSSLESVTLPPVNPYIPKNITLIDSLTNISSPQKIYDEKGCISYWLADNQFNTPTTAAILNLRPHRKMSVGSKAGLLRDFIIQAANYKLQPTLFQAQEVGFDISLEEKEGSFLLKVTGFSDSMPVLLKQMASTLKNLSLSPQEFATIKSDLLQTYQNALAAPPYLQGMTIIKQILSKSATPIEKKIAILNKLTLPLFEKHAEKILSNISLEAFLFGNMTKEDAMQLSANLQSILQTIPQTDLYDPAFFVVSKGPVRVSSNITQLGNFAALILEDGCYSLEKDAALSILTRGLSEPFFSELRTRQQTGYIVKNMNPCPIGLLSEVFLAQSTTYDPDELLFRFELFLEQFSLDEGRFDLLKKSYLEELNAPEKSPIEKAQRLAFMAFRVNGDFEWRNKRIKATENLSYTAFQSFSKALLARSNKQRIAVLLKGMQQGDRSLRYVELPSLKALAEAGSYTTLSSNTCK